jgi:trimethylamine--corrinoid protein Co-methyltransferase
MSYEKFILDLDNCAAMLRLLQGMEVSEKAFARDSYLETGPGENFLSTTDTMANFATANHESILPETGPFETWAERGRLTAAERANQVWKAMLETYVPPPIDPSIEQQLNEFVTARKAAMNDEWY